MAVGKTNATKKTDQTVTAKNNTPKSDIKKAETTTAPVSAKTEVKKEEVKPVPAKQETETKKLEVKKEETPKKASAKTTAAKKTTRKPAAKRGAKRGPKPASERTVELYVQYGGKEVAYTDLVNRIKDMWKEQGKRETSLKTLNIYVKPEDSKAYYVINEEKDCITGEIDF